MCVHIHSLRLIVVALCRFRGGITTDIVSMTGFPIHDEINFIANGRLQRYNVTTGNKITYKLLATPYRK